jgi:NAD(P)-dependent dehydrogenase (short-subunit alcohol dehydrogenase family)
MISRTSAVNLCLYRGPIDTRIFREGEAKGLFNSEVVSAGTLMGRMGKAEEVAKVLVFLLSEDASFVTGGE